MKAVSHPLVAAPGPLSSRVKLDRWPVWRESVRGEIPRRKLERHSVAGWLRYLKEGYTALEALPGRGRALKAIIDGLMRHYDYKTGDLFPALETIAESSGYGRTYVHAMLNVAQELGIIDWTRRCELVKSARGYFIKQTSNFYALRPPAEWAKSMGDAMLRLLHKAMGRDAIPARKAKKTKEKMALDWIERQRQLGLLPDQDGHEVTAPQADTAIAQTMAPPLSTRQLTLPIAPLAAPAKARDRVAAKEDPYRQGITARWFAKRRTKKE